MANLGELPPQRSTGPYRITMVCLGNICRSPMAEVVTSERLAKIRLGDAVTVRSAGTGGWHVGKPMDERAAWELSSLGYDPERHQASRVDRSWIAKEDLILTMDHSNHADVLLLCGNDADSRSRVMMFRDFDPQDTGRDVPDPYYGHRDGFRTVLDIVERTSAVLVAKLAEKFPPPPAPEPEPEPEPEEAPADASAETPEAGAVGQPGAAG